MKATICLIFLLGSILAICECTMILVQPPSADFADKNIQYWYGNFGKIPYGKSLSFQLIPMNDTICSGTNLTHMNSSAYLLVQQSSDCTFTQQARVAQSLGAKGIVFGKQYLPDDSKIIQVNDGNGRKVHITAIFIKKESFQNLLKLKNVEIKVSFDVVKEDKANVTFFLSASGRENYVFLRNFGSYYESLSDFINMDILYKTFPCKFCNSEQCILNNNYCAISREQWTGQNILMQQIRQYNIFKAKGPKLWLQYMNKFDQLCDEDYNPESCAKQILKQLKIENIQQGNIELIMNGWRQKEKSGGFLDEPEVTVNTQLFSGDFNAKQLKEMICNSLNNPSPRGCSDKNQGQSYVTALVAMVIFVCITIPLVIFCYKKMIKKELTNDMSSKVNELVAKYATKVGQMKQKRKDRVTERLNEEI